MKFIITVIDEISGEVSQKQYTSDASKRLMATLNKNLAQLTPLYSGSTAPELQKYFIVDAPSSNLIDELWQSELITSAYIKPTDESPQ